MGSILITGVGGNVGQYIAESLCTNGYSVVGIYRNAKPKNAKYTLRQADLSKNVIQVENVSSVIHVAANLYGNVNEQIRDNINATVNLLEFAKNNYVQNFIYMSSVSVYGKVEGELNLDSKMVSPGIYGATKYIAENLVKESDISNRFVLGLPRMLGPYVNLDNCKNSGFLSMAKKILMNEDVYCYIPHVLYNNYMHVEDLVLFLEVILKHTQNSGYKKLLLGARDRLTMMEILQAMKEAIGSKSQIIAQDKGIAALCALVNINEAVQMGYHPQKSTTILQKFMHEEKEKKS